MKYLKILFLILCLVAYVYSAYMTIVQPDNVLWGYLCTFIFLITAIGLIKQYSKKVINDKK